MRRGIYQATRHMPTWSIRDLHFIYYLQNEYEKEELKFIWDNKMHHDAQDVLAAYQHTLAPWRTEEDRLNKVGQKEAKEQDLINTFKALNLGQNK